MIFSTGRSRSFSHLYIHRVIIMPQQHCSGCHVFFAQPTCCPRLLFYCVNRCTDNRETPTPALSPAGKTAVISHSSSSLRHWEQTCVLFCFSQSFLSLSHNIVLLKLHTSPSSTCRFGPNSVCTMQTNGWFRGRPVLEVFHRNNVIMSRWRRTVHMKCILGYVATLRCRIGSYWHRMYSM